MLSELNIKNFAIIDDLTINFHEGLNVLSGETGAGKSIIINALNLVLGGRPSASLIRNGADEAEIQALFYVPDGSRPVEIIKASDMEADDGIMIRRIISSSGKHRIYINGKIASVQILSEISGYLASISGQHAHQILMKEEQHIEILDSFGSLIQIRNRYNEKYNSMVLLVNELENLKKFNHSKNEQNELYLFQKKEIEDAKLLSGEDDELSKQRLRLRNSVLLQQATHEFLSGLYSGQNSAYSALSGIKKIFEKTVKSDDSVLVFASKADEIIFRIEDLASEIQIYQGSLEANPERLEEIESRLDFLSKLKRKYGGTLESVIDYYEKISRETEALDSLEVNIKNKEKEISAGYKIIAELAKELSEKRKAAAIRLDSSIEQELASLNMKDTSFSTSISVLNSGLLAIDSGLDSELKLNSYGLDRVAFMIAPNAGENPKPLSVIASGGELSRVVLAIKAAMVSDGQLETVVFDEVDTGIGGATAEAVGEKIAAISAGRQVICITHLAQIAKFGLHHFTIEKHVKNGRTSTSIKKLSDTERVSEIARMIGGQIITDATVAHAEELIKNGRELSLPFKKK